MDHAFLSELFISMRIYVALIYSLANCVTMESYLVFLSPSFPAFTVEHLIT